ncbi:MAG: Cna B-type domain-containing protein [Lachnospiraceae bacterium]|nr:Cna B-type domain-containing protein [Lachnospiraceae bacterium]
MNRNFERGGSRKTGTRGLRKFWKVCAWGLSISMILGTGNIGSYIVTADDGEVQVTEIPAETSEPETETSEEPVFSVSPESTPSPEAAAYAVTEMTPAPSESTQPSESPAWTAAPEPSAISTLIPETAAPEPSAASTVLPETAEPVSSPVATEAPASMPEMSFEKKEETTGITVSVKAEAGTFPEETTMELSPVKDQSILEDAKQASELQNPSAVAVDITFRDPDGNIIEPQKQIRVTMTSDVIRQAESVDVVHVPDEAEDTSTAVVDQVPDQNLSEEEKPAEDQVVFDADQFSVYAIVYTVDFTFSGYTYSMEGGSSILLSSLASQLGLHDSEHDIDFDINKVAGVSFSDPSLVSIEQRDNDYMLTSLQPFTSDETLTIAMNDGSKYLVDVKDGQNEQEVNLGDYITSVVTYKKNNNGEWEKTSSIQDGDNVLFQLNFSVNSGKLNQGQKLTYTMDNHITIGQATSGTLYQGTTAVGTVNVDTDGKVTISLNNSFDPTKAFEGNVRFEGTVHNSNSSESISVNFGEKATISIDPKSTSNNYDVSTAKTGSYQTDSNGKHYIRYEVTISTTKGTGGAINFTDSMSANGIEVPQYDLEQVCVYKNGTSDSVNVSPFINNEKKLEIDNLKELKANENYHVIYCVPVNGKITSADGSASVYNKCHAWINNNVQGWGETTTKIQDAVIQKTGYYDSNSRKLKWTITVNNPDEIDLGGSELKDMLSIDGSSSTAVSPLPFTMKDLNGETVVEGTFDNNGSYRFPNGSRSKQYTITYETDAPSGKEGTQSKVNNTAEFTEHGKTYTGTSGDITVDHGNYNVQKWFSQVSSKSEAGEQLSWTAKIDLPDGQLDLNKLKFTDSMTASHGTEMLQGKHYITPALLKNHLKLRVDDTAQKYDIYLEAGTDFQVFDQNENDITNSTEETKLDGFQIRFLDSALSKLQGQNSISLWYDTLTDESEQPAGATWTFKNQAVIPDHKSEASYDYKKPDGDLAKLISLTGNDNSYSSDAPEIEYTGKDITLYYRVMIKLDKNASGNQTIIDTLPAGMTFKSFTEADYFENENYHPNTINSNGHQINLAELAKVSKVEKQADETTKVTFTLSDGYQRNDKDSYIIAFYYTATIKDTEFWTDLHHTEKEYANAVEWGNLSTSVTAKVKHTIKNLDKIAQLSDVEGTNGEIKKAAYYLTINPLGSDLVPGSDTITLKDQISCDQADVQMQFKPESLKVFAYDGSKENHCGDEINQNRYGFSYDEQKHSLELKLPDETPCVVYYEYYVVPGINKAGLSNSASLSGVTNSFTKNGLSLSESTASGSVSRDELTIYKVDSENYRIKLQGVTFKLFQYQYDNNQPSWTEVDSTKMKDSLTTDQYGKLYLNLIDDHLKQDCLYKLKETNVGDNTTYQIDQNKAYYFIWASKDDDQQIWNAIGGDDKSRPKQEEVYFIRHSGTIYVPNENTGITINKVWLNADHSDDKKPPEKATVTLYRQARQPGGVKVTIHVIDQSNNNRDVYHNEVYIKSGTPVSLWIDTDWGETYSVNETANQSFNDGKEHQLELGRPTGNITYTVKVSYWKTQKVIDTYYTPTDQYTARGDKEKVDTKELNSNNNYSWTRGELPLRDENGYPYYYWVEETPVTGYITSYSDNNGKIQKGTITVTNTRESITVTGSKVWKNADGSSNPPAGASCVFELYKDRNATGNRITLDGIVDDRETSAWTAVFSNLEKYDTDGHEIHYTVREDKSQSPEGFAPDKEEIESGGTITNSQEQQLNFTKIWSDGSKNIEWPLGTTIKVTLHRELQDDHNKVLTTQEVATYVLDGSSIKNKAPETAPECTLSEKDDRYVFLISGLPTAGEVDQNGTIVRGTWHYYITEDKVDGFCAPKYRSYDSDGSISEQVLSHAENGQVIINQKDTTFVLPDTGSYGTNLITRSGVIFLLLGGAFLIMRKLLILKSGGEGGGSI